MNLMQYILIKLFCSAALADEFLRYKLNIFSSASM